MIQVSLPRPRKTQNSVFKLIVKSPNARFADHHPTQAHHQDKRPKTLPRKEHTLSTFALSTKAQIWAATTASISDNPAVIRCCNARQVAYDAEFSNSRSNSLTACAGAQAYSDSISILIGYESIRDFIACTAQGILIGSINGMNSTWPLYAALVAQSLISRQPSPKEPRPA